MQFSSTILPPLTAPRSFGGGLGSGGFDGSLGSGGFGGGLGSGGFGGGLGSGGFGGSFVGELSGGRDTFVFPPSNSFPLLEENSFAAQVESSLSKIRSILRDNKHVIEAEVNR